MGLGVKAGRAEKGGSSSISARILVRIDLQLSFSFSFLSSLNYNVSVLLRFPLSNRIFLSMYYLYHYRYTALTNNCIFLFLYVSIV